MMRRTIVSKFMQGHGTIGQAHPDIYFGHMQWGYCGPGWQTMTKQMPAEIFMINLGGSLGNSNDSTNTYLDPEDPRHPIGLIQEGMNHHWDGCFHQMTVGDYGHISAGSRLMQVLYENYLEPFSQNRVCAQLGEYSKVPNNHHGSVEASAEYCGGTASLIGSVMVGLGSVIMEGVTAKGDTNCIYIAEGCQILENCMLMSDACSNLLVYQRQEALNPYQQWDGMDGVLTIKQNTIVEQNCFLDSCHIGPFNRIGHGTKIMKGVTTGTMVHILPGSVVVADTKIGDGELYGGAPAVKLGKISKFEWKRPYFASMLHREAVVEQYRFQSRYGDQIVYHVNAMEELDTLMLKYDDHVTPAIREKMKVLVEGKEPFNHMITRIFQSWSPPWSHHGSLAYTPPAGSVRNWGEHNCDSDPNAQNGSYLNFKGFFHDYKW